MTQIQIPELDEENISDAVGPVFEDKQETELDNATPSESHDELLTDTISNSPSPPPEYNPPSMNSKVRERVRAVSHNELDISWQRTLVERGTRLTLHTSIHRADNPEPGAITALTISRDYKKLFVGDANGRVWQWTVPETMGGRTDRWVNTKKVRRMYRVQEQVHSY